MLSASVSAVTPSVTSAMNLGVGPMMGSTSASGSSASSCTTASRSSSRSPMTWSCFLDLTASTAFAPASAAAGRPMPPDAASAIFTLSSRLESLHLLCATPKVCSALSHAESAIMTWPMRARPTPHRGPASRSAVSASAAASVGRPSLSRHSARLASSAGRHRARDASGSSSSSSSRAKE